MSTYLEVMAVTELEPGAMKVVEVDGHQLLVANVDGSFYISDAHCPHMHGPLVKGTLDGTVLTCPWHGSQFDLTDGRCVRWTDFGPTVKTMASLVRHPRPLRVYDAVVEDGKVLVGSQKEPVEP